MSSESRDTQDQLEEALVEADGPMPMCYSPSGYRDEQTRRKAAEARVEELAAELEATRANLAMVAGQHGDYEERIRVVGQRAEMVEWRLAEVERERDALLSDLREVERATLGTRIAEQRDAARAVAARPAEPREPERARDETKPPPGWCVDEFDSGWAAFLCDHNQRMVDNLKSREDAIAHAWSLYRAGYCYAAPPTPPRAPVEPRCRPAEQIHVGSNGEGRCECGRVDVPQHADGSVRTSTITRRAPVDEAAVRADERKRTQRDIADMLERAGYRVVSQGIRIGHYPRTAAAPERVPEEPKP